MTELYGASALKRKRRTRADLRIVDDAIVAAVDEDKPVTLRGVFYRVVSAGAVPKTEAAYRCVTRELLKLRRDGTVSYEDIVDGTRNTTEWYGFDGTEDALQQTARVYGGRSGASRTPRS
jgi:hypothetical protein